jgi:hypothetical protein
MPLAQASPASRDLREVTKRGLIYASLINARGIFGGNFARIVTNPDRLRTITMLDRVATAELELEEKSAPPTKTRKPTPPSDGPSERPAAPTLRLGPASHAVVSFPDPKEIDDDDWSADNPDVLVAEQRPIRLYVNVSRQIVIHERGWPDDDQRIVIDPKHVELLVKRLEELKKETERLI